MTARPTHRARPRRALAAAVVLPLLLAACTSTADRDGADKADDGGGLFETTVDVDTAELRAAKREAGVEDCRPGESSSATAGGTVGDTGNGLPDIVLPCLGGGPDVNLSSLQGPMVINLWAQWCGPCREELPYYQQLHERAGDKVSVVGIDYQDTLPGRALALVEETGVTYPLLADPAADLRVPFRVRGLPMVLFVDEQGQITHQEFVEIRSYDQLHGLVREHLGVTV